jgi:hypothetical protein
LRWPEGTSFSIIINFIKHPSKRVYGVLMRTGEIIIGALVVLAVCSMASATLDAKVYTLCEKNISMDLPPNFHIVSGQSTSASGSDGVFTHTVTITGIGSKGMAHLEIMDIYDETMKSLDTETLSQLITGAVSYLSSYSSDLETGNFTSNWPTVDFNGENVTVNTMDTKGTALSVFGKKVDMAFWNLEGSRYAYLISTLDKNTTSKIINTLEIN